MSTIKKNWSGILLCLVIAVPAWYLGKLFPVVGGPVLAILIGLLVAIIPRKPSLQSGIQFTSKKVLQYAIILLGFDMNLFHILEVGRHFHRINRSLPDQPASQNPFENGNPHWCRLFHLRRLCHSGYRPGYRRGR